MVTMVSSRKSELSNEEKGCDLEDDLLMCWHTLTLQIEKLDSDFAKINYQVEEINEKNAKVSDLRKMRQLFREHNNLLDHEANLKIKQQMLAEEIKEIFYCKKEHQGKRSKKTKQQEKIKPISDDGDLWTNLIFQKDKILHESQRLQAREKEIKAEIDQIIEKSNMETFTKTRLKCLHSKLFKLSDQKESTMRKRNNWKKEVKNYLCRKKAGW